MTDQPDRKTGNDERLHAFWEAYRATLPAGQRPPETPPQAWYFCDNEHDANELAALVLAGTKTATASLYWAYVAEGEPLPQAGDLSIITTWDGTPQCIIETTEVQVVPFNAVDERQAYEEGEGDRSLAFWRRVHWDVFSRECAQIGRDPSEDMPVVCERFRVLYAPGTR